jgi:hypothetical protein
MTPDPLLGQQAEELSTIRGSVQLHEKLVPLPS